MHVLQHGLDDSNVFVIDGLPEEQVVPGEEVSTQLVAIQVYEGLRQAEAEVAEGDLIMLAIEESEVEGVMVVGEEGLGEELGIAWEVEGEVFKGWRGLRRGWLYIVLLWGVFIKLARGRCRGF